MTNSPTTSFWFYIALCFLGENIGRFLDSHLSRKGWCTPVLLSFFYYGPFWHFWSYWAQHQVIISQAVDGLVWVHRSLQNHNLDWPECYLLQIPKSYRFCEWYSTTFYPRIEGDLYFNLIFLIAYAFFFKLPFLDQFFLTFSYVTFFWIKKIIISLITQLLP